LFIFTRTFPSDLDRLWDCLCAAAPSARKKLLVFDFISENLPKPATAGKDEVRIVKTAYPKTDPPYVWHVAESFNSEQGFLFEKTLVDALIEQMDLLLR
jgi:hypothetical protein